MPANEFRNLVQLYSGGNGNSENGGVMVDFERMSMDLGLHSSKLSLI